MTTITGADAITLLGAAHTALRTAIAEIPASGWDLPTPCEKWTVTQVLQHATGDQIAYAAAITGGPWPTEDPFQPSGRLSEDAGAMLERALDASASAFATVDTSAEQVPVPLPQGPLPLWIAAGACALDAAVHAWDIAVATGRPNPLTPEMAGQLLEVATQIVEPLRAYGAYAAELTAPHDNDPIEALLAYLGRRPGWAPPAV